MNSIDIFGQTSTIEKAIKITETNNDELAMQKANIHITDDIDIFNEQFRTILTQHNIDKKDVFRLIECLKIIEIMRQEAASIIYKLKG